MITPLAQLFARPHSLPMTRKSALAICIVFVGLLAALIILARLSTAGRDERDVLKLAAAQLFDPSACLSILTNPNAQGSYDFHAADKGLRNTALADLDQVAAGRDVRLIAGNPGGAGLDALAKGLLQKPICTSSVPWKHQDFTAASPSSTWKRRTGTGEWLSERMAFSGA